MAGWTGRALARMLGVPATTFSYWVATGLVSAEKVGRGRGGSIIGLKGLMEALAVQKLREIGFQTAAIRQAVNRLREFAGEHRSLADSTLVVVGSDIAWKTTDEVMNEQANLISVLKHPGQSLMVFPMGARWAQLVKEAGEPTEREEDLEAVR